MVPLGPFHLCCLILCGLQAQGLSGTCEETQLKGSEKCLSKKLSEPGREILTHFFAVVAILPSMQELGALQGI